MPPLARWRLDMYLTKRQKEILDYIAAYIERRDYAPTLEEIGAYFGLSSPATVYKHVQQLVQKGYLRKAPHQGRGLRLVDPEPERTVEAPLLGQMNAGRPIEAVRPPQVVNLPPEFAGSVPVYVLRVRGNTLLDEHLMDGDLLVLEDRTSPASGETVVVLLRNDLPMVRRYFDEGNRVRLQPMDAMGEPLILRHDGYRIQGVVIGLIRNYR